ncbi:HlyD family secretion protein [Pseudomonas sp. 10B1]|uniref:HlyD family secretion protein n=1 Tax=unclassified Pseudomonas TaxID=196821 RepID=UPI002AB56BD4|nr:MULTISPECIES: HlyD family secretion protein [unclassified Pseudomonas]MDY7560006.1 HlyD family secretion protein [Pseudomonas sp. AB6]MEA9979379.1 HlyD family secretion protein [Pseudomonas sp. RTS4]MEA9997114.1 HlyD family secretion protein [Pseudomonas sp. AA4]MEB0089308.1 HlyD family secretion protein [Pseudomonas sp. RTI1]MEB0128473.1 HlyD family secretion protein [Pseudomonas sp. CCC1.2]
MNSSTDVSAIDSAVVPTKKRLTLKRVLLWVVLAAVLIGLVVFGVRWWTVGRFIQSTDDAYIGGDVTVIGPKVSGYIIDLKVTDNQQVHAGDLLVKIDDRDYVAALHKTEGAVAAQEALLANLDATEQLQYAVIGQAKASIDATNAETVRSRDDQARYQKLVGQQAVSVESAQRADATFKTAQANGAKAQASMLATQRQIAVISTQKQQARAALMQAKAERDMAQLNVGYTELRSPVDGMIGNRRARVGAFAAAGSQLLSVVPANGLWVDANFKEDQLAHMVPGQVVTIHADVLPGHEFQGHLDSLAPATGSQFSVLPPENATGNFTKIVQRVPVRVRLDEADGVLGHLRPGLSVTAEVDTREDSNHPTHLVTPNQASAP